MTLTPKQIQELKTQLLQQIQHLPKEQQEQAGAQIESMSPEALEIMLQQQSQQSENNIFRLIVNKEVESVIIEENSAVIAVLDINPISEGIAHTQGHAPDQVQGPVNHALIHPRRDKRLGEPARRADKREVV